MMLASMFSISSSHFRMSPTLSSAEITNRQLMMLSLPSLPNSLSVKSAIGIILSFCKTIYINTYILHYTILYIINQLSYYKTRLLSVFCLFFYIIFVFIFYVIFTYNYILCLTASYITIPADTDALSDVISPFIGILINISAFSLTNFPMPKPSLPITIAKGPFKSWL